MQKIVILDGFAANPGDLNWNPIAQYGSLKVFDRTSDELLIDRAKGADIIVVNKRILNRSHFSQLPSLKCICTLATGYNNIDLEAARHFGITICNAVDYSTPSVAQHVFALLLELSNKVGLHNKDVQNSGWSNASDWCYWKQPLLELHGKTMGVYGYGKIGKKVAEIALAFGMKVITTRKSSKKPDNPAMQLVPLHQLFTDSDVISLHAPLTSENREVINENSFSLMKKTAFLINTGRGGLIKEKALRVALETGQIAGAGLDVLSQEPPNQNHVLLGAPNCLITPHQAWATKESRKRLINIVAENIDAFLKGNPRNVVGLE